MRKLRIGVVDLVSREPAPLSRERVAFSGNAGVMAQVVAVWCEEEGHDVTFLCHTGAVDLVEALPQDLDLVFIGSFSQTAQLAYALSALCRSRGAVTVLGGPHARCYPEDAGKYFDYVLGFTDKAVLRDVLQDCSPQRPAGVYLSARGQPAALPGIQERWKFIEPILRKTPGPKMVTAVGSFGCPYACSFCIDATVPWRPMEFDLIKSDLRFLVGKLKRPVVVWHDPNFGIRFNDYLSTIEEAVPPGSIAFIAESSLSLLSEPNAKRLRRNGCVAMLPGVESWFDFGNKSKTGRRRGMDKVREVSDQVNMLTRYVPYVQTNFVLGLDVDEGPESFELTRTFSEMTPECKPVYILLTAYGQAAPDNIGYQRAGRVLPFPFHALDGYVGNVKPKSHAWRELSQRFVDLYDYSYPRSSNGGVRRKPPLFLARGARDMRRMLRAYDEDPQLRRFCEGEAPELPQYFVDWIRSDLGVLWEWLPEGALEHDPNAWLSAPAKPRRPYPEPGLGAAAARSRQAAATAPE